MIDVHGFPKVLWMSDNLTSHDNGTRTPTGERGREIERAIENTRRELDNTRTFLDQLRESEGSARHYIEEMLRRLSEQLQFLQRMRGGGREH